MTLHRVPVSVAAVGTPGLRRVRRADDGDDNDGPAFDLAYVRTGPRTSTPTVVVPGGPGLASVLPYRALRRRAARAGLDLIMVEHRGVGLSRVDLRGRDLPVSAMRVAAVAADIRAVLDREEVETAFLAGSSYGSYVTASFGAWYPERVAGMVLDSALVSSADLDAERRAVRSLLWDADTEIAAGVRRLYGCGVDPRALLDVTRAAYELGGTELLAPLVRARLSGRRGPAWRALEAYSTRGASIPYVPGVYEFDLAGAIGFRDLGYGAPPDGRPLDPALTYAPLAPAFPPFRGEPCDLDREMARFTWPVLLLAGSRDLRTPPVVAERVAARVRNAVLARITNGHSALDTHPAALLSAISHLTAGAEHRLAGWSGRLDELPRRGPGATFPAALELLLRGERTRRGR